MIGALQTATTSATTNAPGEPDTLIVSGSTASASTHVEDKIVDGCDCVGRLNDGGGRRSEQSR